MGMLKGLWAPALLVAAAACEHAQGLTAARQPAPPSVSLSPAARAQLTGVIDFEALDRLLSLMSPGEREHFLAVFADVQAAASRTDVETRTVRTPMGFSDPERQRLLERVFAPHRASLPAAAATNPSYPLPGHAPSRAPLPDSTAAAGGEPRR